MDREIAVGDVIRPLHRTFGLRPAQPAGEPVKVIEVVNSYNGTIRTEDGEVHLLGDYAVVHHADHDVTVTLSKLPYLSDDVLGYILYEAEEGEFPPEVIEAAREEEGKRECAREMYPGQYPPDDTPSLQDRGLYPGSYAT